MSENAPPEGEEEVVWDEPSDEATAEEDDPTTTGSVRRPDSSESESVSAAGADSDSDDSQDSDSDSARPAKPTTTAARRPAPTAAPKPTSPPTTAKPTPKHSEEGEASWYQHIDGTCAHKTIPFDTIVTVTNLQNGRSTTCRVADRGPFGPGRIIDLDKEVFERLAPASQGVFPARITW